ncbi:MAG TPA: hypothetical protein VJU77_11365 [Chthoniobacterales bacterium]|nr:hypothetical protein [Chthoniobacterales bacterium]
MKKVKRPENKPLLKNITVLSPRFTWRWICLAALALAETMNGQALSEIAPTIAVADQQLTLQLRQSLPPEAEGAWTPSRSQVLEVMAFVKSEVGKREILAKAAAGVRMEFSLKRIDQSRFQIFGLLIGGRKHMLIDATPLDSDAPELWLKDRISQNVFDGGAAYWWVLVDSDSREVRSCGRRP